MSTISTGIVHNGRCPHCHQYTWGQHHLCGVTPAISSPLNTAGAGATVNWSMPNTTGTLTGQIPAPNFAQAQPGEPIRVA